MSTIRCQKLKFKKRKDSIIKKTMELSVLCDIKACDVCINPDGNNKTWPQNHCEFDDKLTLYKARGQDNINNKLAMKIPAPASEVGIIQQDSWKKYHRIATNDLDIWLNGVCSQESRARFSKEIEAKIELANQKVEFLEKISSDSKGKEIGVYEQEGEEFSAANYDNTHLHSSSSSPSPCWYYHINTEEEAASFDDINYYQPQTLQSFAHDIYQSSESGGCSNDSLILEETIFEPVDSDNNNQVFRMSDDLNTSDSNNQVSSGGDSFILEETHNLVDNVLGDDCEASDWTMLEGTEFDYCSCNNGFGKQFLSPSGDSDGDMFSEQSPLDQFVLAHMFPDQMPLYWPDFS